MTRFAEEYGNALFELAEEEHILDQIAAELKQMMALLNQQKDYIRLLGAQSIDANERKALIDEAFGGSVHPYLIRFVKLLIDRGAVSFLPECAKVYQMRYYDAKGMAVAHVISAAALTPSQVCALQEKLCAISGKKVELEMQVDPELIGGLRVDLLGKRYDNSIQTQLQQLRRSLTEQE